MCQWSPVWPALQLACLQGTLRQVAAAPDLDTVDQEVVTIDLIAAWLQVTPQGKYRPPPKGNQKATYATMLFVRSDIVANSARYLAKAACIAVRYCCVRRQTAPAPGEPEWQVRAGEPGISRPR